MKTQKQAYGMVKFMFWIKFWFKFLFGFGMWDESDFNSKHVINQPNQKETQIMYKFTWDLNWKKVYKNACLCMFFMTFKCMKCKCMWYHIQMIYT